MTNEQVAISSSFRSQLRRRMLQARLTSSGLHKGQRRARTFGHSLDFSDYRAYHPGDDVRQMDWNVYARTQKYYIKRFLDEQELSVHLILDCSQSMAFDQQKWHRMKEITAALGFMSLAAEDRLSVSPLPNSMSPFRSKKGTSHVQQLFQYVQRIQSFEGTFADQLMHMKPTAGLCIVISDFLEPLDVLQPALKMLRRRSSVRLVQMLSEEELQPSFLGDLQLIDTESGKGLNVSARSGILKAYKERLADHTESLNSYCLRLGMELIQVSAAQSSEDIVLKEMTKKGWVK
ncbi:DUF58 domain-containing protein [Aureibacillus halotolerans]|uniref:Uncharacterized protein DUF58 n=1 Tax=Aureibacillus halotolerans TaxID=1508390 RepID=A0A4R6U4D1_9BACI|nr:DUF58 domain-containing protein [Aureibacillus halotolerans]TDQ40342.1 uncharacterized protein DUF58 [Aureibacillus halotolerans]